MRKKQNRLIPIHDLVAIAIDGLSQDSEPIYVRRMSHNQVYKKQCFFATRDRQLKQLAKVDLITLFMGGELSKKKFLCGI